MTAKATGADREIAHRRLTGGLTGPPRTAVAMAILVGVDGIQTRDGPCDSRAVSLSNDPKAAIPRAWAAATCCGPRLRKASSARPHGLRRASPDSGRDRSRVRADPPRSPHARAAPTGRTGPDRPQQIPCPRVPATSAPLLPPTAPPRSPAMPRRRPFTSRLSSERGTEHAIQVSQPQDPDSRERIGPTDSSAGATGTRRQV